jgi:uncharacterized protein
MTLARRLLLLAGLVLAFAPAAQATSALDARLYQPDPLPARLDWAGMPEPETVAVTTEDGVVLKGYRWRATEPSHVALVFFHGNGGNRYTAAQMAAPLRRPDADIIVASYRGYGDNPGKPSEDGLYADGRAFVKLARDGAPTRMFLFGYSLGGAVALRLAGEGAVDGVVTLGTPSSIRALASPLVRGAIPNRFDSIAAIKQVRAPVVLLHGTADELVPLNEAKKLEQAAPDRVTLVRLLGGTHHVDLAQISVRLWRGLLPGR